MRRSGSGLSLTLPPYRDVNSPGRWLTPTSRSPLAGYGGEGGGGDVPLAFKNICQLHPTLPLTFQWPELGLSHSELQGRPENNLHSG